MRSRLSGKRLGRGISSPLTIESGGTAILGNGDWVESALWLRLGGAEPNPPTSACRDLTMRVPRVRFTIRVMMGIVALTGVLLPACIDLIWRYRLVEFEYTCEVDNMPLLNPIAVVGINPGGSFVSFVLADGRVISIEDGLFQEGMLAWDQADSCKLLVDVESQPDGFTTIYKAEEPWYCGTCLLSRRTPWLRIPIFARVRNRRFRQLVGHGRVVVGSRSDFGPDGRPPDLADRSPGHGHSARIQ
jgi:hypothetical protein